LFLAVLTAMSTVFTLLGLRFLSLHEHVGFVGATITITRREGRGSRSSSQQSSRQDRSGSPRARLQVRRFLQVAR
jgi:hypothetical protein